MNRRTLILGTALALLPAVAYAGDGQGSEGAPKRHGALVASRIGGVWVLAEEPTKRLDGSTAILSLAFSPDAKIHLAGKVKDIFERKNVCQTGKVKMVRRQDLVVRAKPLELPYILFEEGDILRISAFGVPTQVLDPPSVPNSNASIIFVPAKEKQNDLLFVGGDMASMAGFSVHGPFAAYERQKTLKQAVLQAIDLSRGHHLFNRYRKPGHFQRVEIIGSKLPDGSLEITFKQQIPGVRTPDGKPARTTLLRVVFSTSGTKIVDGPTYAGKICAEEEATCCRSAQTVLARRLSDTGDTAAVTISMTKGGKRVMTERIPAMPGGHTVYILNEKNEIERSIPGR